MPHEYQELIYSVSAEINNFFVVNPLATNAIAASGTINDTIPTEPFLYCLIVGVGFFKLQRQGMTGNNFELLGLDSELFGTTGHDMYLCKIPPRFMRVVEDIGKWIDSEAGEVSAMVSENIAGVYSYQRATTTDGAPVGWVEVFANSLRPYRKPYSGIRS